jgi:phosphatidylinositol alpha-1,6-mannosyltransferase
VRVGVVTDAFPPEVGGVQTFAEQYVEHLATADAVDTVEVLAFTDGETTARDGLVVRRVGDRTTPATVLRGLQWFRRNELDVVHSLTLYPGGVVAALCSQLFDAEAFVTVHGLDAMSLVSHPVLGPVHRAIFSSVSAVLFLSNSTMEKTLSAYGRRYDARQIYPGAPVLDTDSDGASLPETDDDEFVVATVARLVERKGTDDLIDAVAGLSGVTLWIAGDGPRREALQQHAEATDADSVRFLGRVPDGALHQVYAACDLFCLPSIYIEDEGDVEGLGLVFLEAQTFGVPVIGTHSGGIPEALADGETGFLVDERAPEQIADRITQLRDDPELYEAFSSRAESFVAERFSWERCVQEHLDVYGV